METIIFATAFGALIEAYQAKGNAYWKSVAMALLFVAAVTATIAVLRALFS